MKTFNKSIDIINIIVYDLNMVISITAVNIDNRIQEGAIYMSNYSVVLQEAVNGISCDFYGDGLGEFFMTRRQIGEALGYAKPRQSIEIIHRAHRERLDRFSTVIELMTVEGGREVQREMVLYSAKGVYEICRWSRQPAADAFYDRVYDILEGLRTGKIRASLLPQQDQAVIAMRESVERTVVEWFEILEAALQSGRYYLIPRSSQEEYRRPLDQTLGIYDNHFYFINGRVASELYAEVHPEFPRRAFYSVLMAAGIMPPEPAESYSVKVRHAGIGTKVYLYGKQIRLLRLIRRNCPVELTTIGECTRYFLSKDMPEDAKFFD